MSKNSHGLSHKESNLYSVWNTMRHRCYNPKHHKFRLYGANGITICDEWKNDFFAFYNWSIANGYRKGLTIDRIDNADAYCPSNCRWVNQQIQQRNRTNNTLLTFNNQTKCLAEWAEISNIPRATLSARIHKLKWSAKKALTTPLKNHNKISK